MILDRRHELPMELRVEDYVTRRRDPAWERELARTLRRMNEDERLRFIQDWIVQSPSLALLFAHKCLRHKHSFYWVIQFGLDHGDASSIEAYLKCAVPRLGFRRTVAYLSKQLPLHPKAVGKALYWLPQLLGKGDARGRQLLGDLLESAKLYPEAQRKPIHVDDPNKSGAV